MKLSDYVFSRLKEWGARHVFLVTGGGAMHLNDSIGTSGLHYICTHHEQAAAMAAEGYARIANAPGVLNVTTGPGGMPIIAPFFADVDTRGSGSDIVTYSYGNTTYNGRPAFCVDWVNVGYFKVTVRDAHM